MTGEGQSQRDWYYLADFQRPSGGQEMTHATTILFFRRGDVPLPLMALFLVFLFGSILVSVFRLYDLNEHFVRWRTKGKSHDWPMMQARIDVATGIQREVGQTKYGPIYSYFGVLSYFYNAQPASPTATADDLQMGEFEKQFASLDEAKEWAQACKGLAVTVRVNPRNAEESILLDEDVPRVPGF